MNFFQQPLALTSRFTLPSRAVLSPMEGIMNRDNFFRAAAELKLIDSWMPPFIGIPPAAPPKAGSLRRRFRLFLESGIPLTVQLLGHDPEAMGQACRTLSGLGVASVNVNCACPSPTVIGSGSGAALLRRPDLLKQILLAVRNAAPEICLSVKLRSGFHSPDELPGILAAVREGGVRWVILHYRTAAEMYDPSPAIEALRRFRTARTLLPDTVFFANGDIATPADADRVRRECSCDGVAVGRGILRDPFLLRAIVTGEAAAADLRAEFLRRLTDGIANRRRRHFQLECVKMAYGEDSPEFRAALSSVQHHESPPG